jgi:integrase
LHGRLPYRAPILGRLGFTYPPFAALLVAPLAFAPALVDEFVVTALSMVLLVWVLRRTLLISSNKGSIVSQQSSSDRQDGSWSRAALIAAAAVWLAPVSVVTFMSLRWAKRGLTVSTIRRHAAAVARAHRQAGHLPPTSDPAFLTVLEGIARVQGAAPNKKTALLRDPLLEMIDRIDTSTNVGLRNRALLLVGFAVGLRRSELVAISVEDLSPSLDGMIVRIARSKTDQQSRCHELLRVYGQSPNPCPVRAVRAWLDASATTSGPVFRRVTCTGAVSSPLQAEAVATIIKRRAKSAGLNAAEFAGHSLRSGYATQAARDGHRPTQIADITRHKDQRVLAGYARAGKGRDDVAHVL